MNQQFGPLLYTIAIWALPAIIAITFHEAALGFVALRFGDDTALRLGRVTFNPLKIIGTPCYVNAADVMIFSESCKR
jgi:Zn-dependent protease